jgi:imidazolonepropionase-like amidohydrolase
VRRRIASWQVTALVLLSFVWASCARAPVPPPKGATVIVFQNVNVVPMTADRVLEHQDVWVVGDRVWAVTKTGQALPKGAQVIDATDKFLMPGLADMHAHVLDESWLRLFVAAGVTTVRNMFGTPFHLEWREKIRKGELIGPALYTSGPVIDGRPPVIPGSAVVEDANQAAREVGAELGAGYDFIKVYSALNLSAFTGVVEAAKRSNVKVAGHVPVAVGLYDALSIGQSSIEHLSGYSAAMEDEQSPLWGRPEAGLTNPAGIRFAYANDDKLRQAVAATKKAGAYNCVTLVVKKKLLDAAKGMKLPSDYERPFVPLAIEQTWRDWERQNSREIKTLPVLELQKAHDIRLKLTRALSDAGAPLLLGTDAGNPYVAPGYSLHEELSLLVSAGLTPFQALKAGTVEAARFFGAEKDRGTVEGGKRADLLLVDANPLEKVENARRIAGVMLGGRWIPASEFDRLTNEPPRLPAP